MKFETFKTLILIVLVGLSLLLTYSLWSFQPNYDRYKSDSKYVSEVDLGGEVLSKRNIVKPQSMIFHFNEKYYSFSNPSDAHQLFADLQEYTLSNFKRHEDEEVPETQHMLEIMFPESLPVSVIDGVFTLDDAESQLPTWSFKNMFLTIDHEQSLIEAYFLSVDGREKVSFTIESSNAFQELATYTDENSELEEYFLVEEISPRIFLPIHEPSIQSRTLAIERATPSHLVDALFRNPALVSPNVGEAYFTDGQRGMRVLNDGKSIEYINPIQSTYERMEIIDLLNESISTINDHKGWTDDYILESITSSANQVVYRMHYVGYPVFHQGNLTVIEHQIRQQDVYKYWRPLYHLKSSFGGNTVHLPSGVELFNYLKEQLGTNIEHIRDIRLGFYLIYEESEAYSVQLKPAWFMNYNGQWQQVQLIDSEQDLDEGGR